MPRPEVGGASPTRDGGAGNHAYRFRPAESRTELSDQTMLGSGDAKHACKGSRRLCGRGEFCSPIARAHELSELTAARAKCYLFS